MTALIHINHNPIAGLVEMLETLPLVEEASPDAGSHPFFKALAAMAGEEADKLWNEGRFVSRFSILPIVAVAGLLNAGKSSTVYVFLSPDGRRRVLRGGGSDQGTHRFTLWVPSAWAADPELRARFDATLTEVFGHAPQPLSDDVAQALDQQRERGKLGVPLLAFDPALDSHGIALLDCPDIERSEKGGRGFDSVRCEMLQKAAGLCAAVVIVARRESIETAVLEKIAGIMPAAVRFLAVNHIPGNESPESVLADVRKQLTHMSGPCYLAYSYRDKEYAVRTPGFDSNLQVNCEEAPCFFEGSPEPGGNDPASVEPTRTILHLTRHVTPDQMCQRRQRELLGGFSARVRSKLAEVCDNVGGQAEVTASAKKGLHQVLLVLWTGDGELRMAFTPENRRAIGESLHRTAPWDIQAMLVTANAFGAVWNGVKRLGSWIFAFGNPAQAVDEAAAAVGEKLRVHFEDAALGDDQLRSALAGFGAGHGISRPKEEWAKDAAAVLERFSRAGNVAVSNEEWDRWSAQLWESASTWTLRLKIAVLIPVLLYAAAHTTFEPLGGTAIWGITMKELLATLGLGGVAAASMASSVKGDLHRQVARRQYANFHAVVCDRIGMPRGIPAEAGAVSYPRPDVPEERNPDAVGVAKRLWVEAHVLPENLATIQNQIPADLSP